MSILKGITESSEIITTPETMPEDSAPDVEVLGAAEASPDADSCGGCVLSVDVSGILAAQQEQLAVLRSCNTLLLILALFAVFRLARGLSAKVLKGRE